MSNINKKMGVDFSMNESLLNLMVTLFSIINGIARLGIGILTDYVSFKLIISVFVFINVIFFFKIACLVYNYILYCK